jgi:hypothetical protein
MGSGFPPSQRANQPVDFDLEFGRKKAQKGDRRVRNVKGISNARGFCVMAESTFPNRERRAWVRYPTSQEICCQPIAPSTAGEREIGWVGKLRDISSGGLVLALRRRFEPGTLLIIELPGKAKGQVRPAPIRVVRVRLAGKRQYTMGCEFISPLSDEELQAVLRPQTLGWQDGTANRSGSTPRRSGS